MNKKIWTTKWGAQIEAYFRINKNDWNTHQSILAEDEYFFNHLEGTIGIDIGAFIGSASLAMASKNMQVIAIEVLPENIEMINKNLQLNNFQDKVTILHRAINSDYTTIVKAFYGNPNTDGKNVHEFIGHTSQKLINDRFVEVQSISLNEIFTQYNLSHCDILKIDCEGGEWPCFEAANNDVLSKIHYIVGELHTGQGEPRGSLTSFKSLLGDRFENKSLEFGFKPQPDTALQGFIFVNRDW